MPRKFYYPPKAWHPTYVHPFFYQKGQYIRTNDPNWISLHRLNKFNFLLCNVLEPPTAPVPLSRIGPPHKVSELRILERPPTQYIPPANGVWEFWLCRRFRVFNFFKYNISSVFLESPPVPSPPNRKWKFSELEESEN
jgi:hypothetical protein